MASCKGCIHYSVCGYVEFQDLECKQFKPSADVVEVVRCKDCRMFVDNKEALVAYCKRVCKNLTVNPSDFCSYGERKLSEKPTGCERRDT